MRKKQKKLSIIDYRLSTKQGFTLIELVLVVIIIGALAAMIMPRLAGRSEQAKVAVAKTDISANMATALDLYELDNGRYPGNLQMLLTDPGGLSNWNGPYIKRKSIDPWGREYQYRYPSSKGRDYDLYSLGPDGVESGDDITNWKD